MFSKDAENGGRAITINCGTTCQKVAEAGVSIGAILVAVPTACVVIAIFARCLYAVLYFVAGTVCDDRRSCSNDILPVLGTFFGTVALIALSALVIVWTISNWNKKR